MQWSSRFLKRFLLVSLASLPGCGSTPQIATEPPPVQQGWQEGDFATAGFEEYATRQPFEANVNEQNLAQQIGLHAQSSALQCLARETAAFFSHYAHEPDPKTVAFLSHHCGYPGRPLHLALSGKNLNAIASYLRTIYNPQWPAAVGVVEKDHRVSAALLYDPSALSLEPFSRRLPSYLKGQLIESEGLLELWDHRGQALPIASDEEHRFEAQIPAKAGDRIELTLERWGFRQILAQFDLRPLQKRYEPPQKPQVDGNMAQTLAQKINLFRKNHGVTELRYCPKESAELTSWMDQINAAPLMLYDERGWPYLQEYIFSEGQDASQLFEIIEFSPTSKKTLLADASHLAIGLKPFESGDGYDAIVLILRAFEEQSLLTIQEQLKTQIAEIRQKQGLNPLLFDEKTSQVAEQLAQELISQTLEADQALNRLQTLMQQAQLKGHYSLEILTFSRPEEIDWPELQSLTVTPTATMGLGLVYGPLPPYGIPQNLAVFVILEPL